MMETSREKAKRLVNEAIDTNRVIVAEVPEGMIPEGMMYRIQWASPTGKHGCGMPLGKSVAFAWIDDLRKRYLVRLALLSRH